MIQKISSEQEDFWSQNPCGGESEFARRTWLKYAKEPWISLLHKEIVKRHRRILEIGFGQGVDAYHLAALLPKDGEYIGIDYSKESIVRAEQSRTEAAAFLSELANHSFELGDAQDLRFEDSTQECVYSIGVLHHTADPKKAVKEVFRVLEPNGTAYIALYARPSIKVGIAKILRGFQWSIDQVLGRERSIYGALKDRKLPWFFGTMLHECFGVQWIWWFSRREICELFSSFHEVEISRVGYNLPFVHYSRNGKTPLGYFWLITARKPANDAQLQNQ